MRSTAEPVDVVCPRCGEEFADWHTVSRPVKSSTECPRCGHDLASDPLIHEDGLWLLSIDDDES